MAALIAIEEESGTGTGRAQTHNGYYAGDFFAEQRGVRGAVRPVVPPSPRQPSPYRAPRTP